MRSLLKNKYSASYPFKICTDDFVKDSDKDIDKLNILNNILSTKLPSDVALTFKQIIDTRNWFAHGKRFGKSYPLTLEDTVRCLDKVIDSIE